MVVARGWGVEKIGSCWSKRDNTCKPHCLIGLRFRIYEELPKLNSKKMHNTIRRSNPPQKNTWKHSLPKRIYRWVYQYLKRFSTWLSITEIKLKLQYHYIPTRRDKMKNGNTKCWWACKETGMLYAFGGNCTAT